MELAAAELSQPTTHVEAIRACAIDVGAVREEEEECRRGKEPEACHPSAPLVSMGGGPLAFVAGVTYSEESEACDTASSYGQPKP
jgi:hypothetical protein